MEGCLPVTLKIGVRISGGEPNLILGSRSVVDREAVTFEALKRFTQVRILPSQPKFDNLILERSSNGRTFDC